MSVWSSFNDDKATFDAWREFLNEDATAVEDEELLREVDWMGLAKGAAKMGGEALKQALPAMLAVVIKYVPEGIQSAQEFMHGAYWTGHVKAGFSRLSSSQMEEVYREIERGYETASTEAREATEDASLEVSETDSELEDSGVFSSLPGVDDLLSFVDNAATSLGGSDRTVAAEAKTKKKKKEPSLQAKNAAIRQQIDAHIAKMTNDLRKANEAALKGGRITEEQMAKYQETILLRMKAMKKAAYSRATEHALKATAELRAKNLGRALSSARSEPEGEKKGDPTELEPSDYDVGAAGKLSDIDPSQYDTPENRGTVRSAPEKVKMAEKPTAFSGAPVGYGQIQRSFEEMFTKGSFSDALQAWAEFMAPWFPAWIRGDKEGLVKDYEHSKDDIQLQLRKEAENTFWRSKALQIFYALAREYPNRSYKIDGKGWDKLTYIERRNNIVHLVGEDELANMIRNIVTAEDADASEPAKDAEPKKQSGPAFPEMYAENEQKILNHWKLLAGIK